MIRYADVPKEAERALKPHLARWKHLIPSWCHELIVEWRKLDDAPAEIVCEVEYRFAIVTFDPSWLDESETERDSIVRHEICHLIVEPLAAFTEDMLGRCVADDSVFRSWTQDGLRRLCEGTVVDLAKALGDGRPRK